MGTAEQNRHKYIFDMGKSNGRAVHAYTQEAFVVADGNGWSGRFHRLMAGNSAILKSTVRVPSVQLDGF